MSATGGDPELVFLFTDIEGSTRLWERDSVAMQAALARHNALIDAAVASHSGRIFKTMGDGMFAVFAEPLQALEAAISAQQALVATDWSELGLKQYLGVRMALHAGVAQEQAGDFSGVALNRLARLLAAGHGSQILLFASVAERISELPAGVEFRDLGERWLRDVPGTERVLQVLAPGLPASFPPLNALDPAPHNLPSPPFACIDREAELAQVRIALTQSDARLVTLTGPGGIGKTRLALQVAFDLLDSFPDGIWFVDLSPVREEEQVVSAVIRALGIPDRAGRSPDELLRAWLHERHTLIVLDNCEHVVAGGAAVAADVIRSAANVRLLATSRIPLGIRGEHQLLIEPLRFPDESASLDVATAAASASVLLFVARAAEARPAFALTPANVGAVATICRQVEGIPLALELAAARVAILSPEALQERLNRRLPLLTSGSRDQPARLQTLRNAIDWSYELLPLESRALFRRLAVFAGGCTLDAAERIFAADPGILVLDTLSSLVTQNLLRADPAAADGPRFSMLETIREFAVEELERALEADSWREAHAEYFLQLSFDAAPHLLGGPQQQEWMARIDREYANLRGAALWWLQRQAASNVLELCTNIWHYWAIRGNAHEGMGLLRKALALPLEDGRELRANALRKLGNLSINVGDTNTARPLYEESYALDQMAGNPSGLAESLSDLGMVAMLQGAYDEAAPLLTQSADLWRELKGVRGEAIALNNLAIGAREQGNFDEAISLHQRVIAMQELLEDRIGIAWSHYLLSRVAKDRGRLEEARNLTRQALRAFEESGDIQAIALVQEVIASIALSQGKTADAIALLERSLRIQEARSDKLGMAESLEGLAMARFAKVDLEGAAESLERANGLREQTSCPTPPIDDRKLQPIREFLAGTRLADQL